METLTLREAAALCGLSVTAQRRRADRGSLRTTLHGNVRRVPRSELERIGLLELITVGRTVSAVSSSTLACGPRNAAKVR